VSLFTNIPLQETIDIVADYVYSESNSKQPPFKKLQFKRMLKLATSGIFAYKNILYRQIDGVSMGSPLAPILANFFLCHLEYKLLDCDNAIKPRMYLRYVDDIFTVFSANTDHGPFFETLNALHPNIKFTLEIGDNSLAFLDTQITIRDADFDTWVYRKPTHTGVILNNSALCPTQWKTGLLICLLSRAWSICSNYNVLHNEFEKLKTIFIDNGYSKDFFDSVLNRFLHKKFNPPPHVIDDDPEKKYVLKIPFIGQPSLLLKKRITRAFKEHYDATLRCVFESYKTKNMFSLKCRSHSYLSSNVVYKFTCQQDAESSYIGETKRHIGVRAEEHLSIDGHLTAIGSHIKDCDKCFELHTMGQLSYKNFKIIKTGSSKFDIEVLESLLIKKHRPTINVQQLFTYSFTLRIFS